MRGNGTVKLTNNQFPDPQDIGLVPVVNTPCWASDWAVSLNLTMPSGVSWSDGRGHSAGGMVGGVFAHYGRVRMPQSLFRRPPAT